MRARFLYKPLIALVAAVSLFACTKGDKAAGDSGAAVGAATGGKTFTIAMIAKSSTNPVFLSGRRGAAAAAEELSKEHNMTVKIDWLTPPNEDGTVQAQKSSQAVNGGANAILQDAAAEVLRVKNAYPDVNGFAMIGGWALFTTTLLTDLDPKKIRCRWISLKSQKRILVRGRVSCVTGALPTSMQNLSRWRSSSL